MPHHLENKTFHVGRPNVGDLETFHEHLRTILETRWFTNDGPFVQELEERLCDYLGVKHCIAVCNGTVGLQIAFHALELSGEVITTPYTFVATPHAIQWERLTPVFADIDRETHNICPNSIEERITEKTTAIVPVHIWGRPCNVLEIEKIANRHGLLTIYDAAHAFGCSFQDRMIGNFGNCEVFSFHATKFFSTFEGGAIATNDDSLAAKARLIRNFGFSGYDKVIHLGTNGKMSEIHAAMGLACFDKISEILATNKRHSEAYRSLLSGLPGVKVVDYATRDQSNFQYVIIEVDEEKSGKHRDKVMEFLHAKNVIARRYFYPGCHRMEPYASLYPDNLAAMPNTVATCDRVLALPTGPSLTDNDVSYICELIRACILMEPHRT